MRTQRSEMMKALSVPLHRAIIALPFNMQLGVLAIVD